MTIRKGPYHFVGQLRHPLLEHGAEILDRRELLFEEEPQVAGADARAPGALPVVGSEGQNAEVPLVGDRLPADHQGLCGVDLEDARAVGAAHFQP